MRSRAWRRFQTIKQKRRVRSYWIAEPWISFTTENGRTTIITGSPQRALGRAARTPHPCSCWACGHRRQYLGPTVQERRSQ